MIWSQQGHLHQLLMISLASVNLIGAHWSHGALALDGWLAMTCVWSPLIDFQSFITLWLQLGFGESIRVLVKWLITCEPMADSQLSQTHSLISNDLLRYSNSSLIQAIAWHCYCNYSLFIEYTERKPFWFWLTPFLSYLLIISWWDWLFVPRSMCKINSCLMGSCWNQQ